MANPRPIYSQKHGDDPQDQIGSMGSTPTGIATPQPDPSDKRVPGIMPSFFAQVGAGSDSTSNPTTTTTTSIRPSSSSSASSSSSSSSSSSPPPPHSMSSSSCSTHRTPGKHSSDDGVVAVGDPCQQTGETQQQEILSDALKPPTSTSHSPPLTESANLLDRGCQNSAPVSTPSRPATAQSLEVISDKDYFLAPSKHTSSGGGGRADADADAGAGAGAVNPLPTPPRSSFCSIAHRDTEEAENGAPEVDTGVSSVYRALKNLIFSKSSQKQKPKRHTSFPVSSVSPDAVMASHFSKSSRPSSQSLSKPTSLSSSSKSSSQNHNNHLHHPHSISSSCEDLGKLTDSVAAGPRTKNTPPLTPRAMSNETDAAEKRDPPRSIIEHSPPHQGNNTPDSNSQGGRHSTASSSNARKSKSTKPSASSRSSGASEESGVPVTASLKGKLTVKIVEGRGLRPSVDPYVVCVFEWNEYISKGAKPDEKGGQSASMAGHGAGSRNRLEALGSVPIQRSNSDSGRPMAIPMKSRQSSHNSMMDGGHSNGPIEVTDPQWNHDAVFDVLGHQSELDVSVYDRSNHEAFLGHLKLSLHLKDDHTTLSGWYPLQPLAHGQGPVSGEIYLQMSFQKTDKKQFGPNDFQILKLIGKGTFGQVYQVRKKDTQRIYAMKVLSKKVIIQKKEIAHTLGERNILVRTAMTDSPFIVGLKFSFQTPTDLYLVTDYMSGGELFWHLQKEGRFLEARAKFYIAELILALQHLHDHDIVYRDLKPENILLDANGHIALCDFGLSKANLTKDDTTNTFCGTTEYLAPEVLLNESGYTKMVDFWSLGVLVFEMCCGWSPFYAEDTQQMYKNIAFGKVRFPRDALSAEGRNFVKGLLNRNPEHRLGYRDDAKELMAHPFFHDIDWVVLANKGVIPPFKPTLTSVMDTSYFDPEFTTALEQSASLNARAAALANGLNPAGTPLSPGMQANFKGFTFVNESSMEHHMNHGENYSSNTADDYMEEDFPEQWAQPHKISGGSSKAGTGHSAGPDHSHRMSGVERTSTASNGDADAGIFHDDYHFEM
ncbi:AGC/AKT protein kinase [Trichophyton interdigitale MR816]|uniref:non-specific serine/threonine protein kinase n=1 Tax=Trichophyton interdigitale (strain MR816) TaxID=1215338 RepID=A0A059J4X4_TRIIM|nr:AGC/AKT protein kinase [Trichophyton interdigitale MR816]